jgi:hypothetical protein
VNHPGSAYVLNRSPRPFDFWRTAVQNHAGVGAAGARGGTLDTHALPGLSRFGRSSGVADTQIRAQG